ncbi:MAG: hypothetical protein GY792_33205 [Gammaproteobacteria bacterium]|nr:hypothetical protein [Gammaproteobacteria bacterium]
MINRSRTLSSIAVDILDVISNGFCAFWTESGRARVYLSRVTLDLIVYHISRGVESYLPISP